MLEKTYQKVDNLILGSNPFMQRLKLTGSSYLIFDPEWPK